ncbi:urea ABC transporter permease subunit UrtB [Gluconacetobacter sp. Hr-1-5]|uniref:urea ABC transporter permease subunit UrtB n=1 Tax=Gluconacetobacter sp. Hr-1-5 TaxID=3395370 RepID=UPI003B52C2FA
MRNVLAAVAVAILLAAGLPMAAGAQDAPAPPSSADAVSDDPYAGLASMRFDDVATAVTHLGTAGDQQALPVLQALEQHRLWVAREGGALYIRSGEQYVDARTGQPASPEPGTVRAVRVNNRVRLAVAAALAERQLAAGSPGERLAAAQTLYQRHDPALLPAIDRALAHAPDGRLHAELEIARAATLLSPGGPDVSPEDQARAVAALRAAGGMAARSVLLGAADMPRLAPETRRAARDAVAAIDFRLRLWGFGQDVFYGLSLGSVLLLAAMGLAITFGVMGVINMAHGELMMIGAYTTYLTQRAVASFAPGLEPFALLLAIPAAFAVCGGIGILIERGLIRFLYGRPLETLLATWGLSLVLQQAVRSLFGPTNVAVSTPSWLAGSFALGGLDITGARLAIMLFAGAVMVGLMVVMRRTPLGLQMRAVTQNRRMAALMGIPTARVDALTFALGSGIAGLAGVAVSLIDNVSPNLGQGYIIDSFLVVVFGGVGNLWGTLAAAATLGVGGKALEPLVGAVSGKILLLVLVILFIQRHPRGMFPLRGRGVES